MPLNGCQVHVQRDSSRGCFKSVQDGGPRSNISVLGKLEQHLHMTSSSSPPHPHPPPAPQPSVSRRSDAGFLESARKQITPRLTGRSSIRCSAWNGLESNYVKSELRLKGGNKQGALMFYSSRTPQNTSCIKQQRRPAETPMQSGASSSSPSSSSLPPPAPHPSASLLLCWFLFLSLQIEPTAVCLCAKIGADFNDITEQKLRWLQSDCGVLISEITPVNNSIRWQPWVKRFVSEIFIESND